MNSNPHNPMDSAANTNSGEETLRLIANLPVPEGLKTAYTRRYALRRAKAGFWPGRQECVPGFRSGATRSVPLLPRRSSLWWWAGAGASTAACKRVRPERSSSCPRPSRIQAGFREQAPSALPRRCPDRRSGNKRTREKGNKKAVLRTSPWSFRRTWEPRPG